MAVPEPAIYQRFTREKAKSEALQTLLDQRHWELLNVVGPCRHEFCRLHLNHEGSCRKSGQGDV